MHPASYATPYQVISLLWQSTLSDFDARWSVYVQRYVQLNDDHATLHQLYNRIFHCGIIDTFFSHLYIDANDRSLVYVLDELRIGFDHPQLESIESYWIRTDNKAYQLFYARYFDWVARCFIATVYQVSACRALSDRRSELQDHATQLHDRLHDIYPHLKGYCFEHCYARQLRRYQDLLALL